MIRRSPQKTGETGENNEILTGTKRSRKAETAFRQEKGRFSGKIWLKSALFLTVGLIFLITMAFTSAAIPAEEYGIPGEDGMLFWGDVNGDGRITVTDAIVVLRSVVGIEDLNPARALAAGVSGKTGKPSVNDALLILRRVIGLNRQFPVEELAGDSARLPVVGTYEKLQELLQSHQQDNPQMVDADDGSLAPGLPESPAREDSFDENKAGDGADRDYSETNLQVAGVDEADIVKTDGTYIYQVRDNAVTISRVYPPGEMEVVTHLKLADGDFQPSELFLDGNHLVVMGSKWYGYYRDYPEPAWQDSKDIDSPEPVPDHEPDPMPDPAPEPEPDDTDRDIIISPMPWYGGGSTTGVYVFDISDKEDIKLLRELHLEGSYLTSRKIDSRIYLLTEKYEYGIYRDGTAEEEPDFKITYYDSVLGEEAIRNLGLDQIEYFPGVHYPNFLTIAVLDLAEPEEPALVDTYLGAGGNVYMSRENLYIAVPTQPYGERTSIYKFRVEENGLNFAGSGEVAGTVLNQFSMDEHDGYFRIATTYRNWGWWDRWELESYNNVYILNSSLRICGLIEGIAPGESIFSARFTGKRGYLVTFEMIDPFFVLDLSNPYKPAILGELKIPGFSNYLHPLDDNHVLGIGRDTEVIGEDTNWPSLNIKGIKLAVFDVTDPLNPREKFVELIGDSGSYSDALHNHKAFLFNPATGLLAFPALISELQETGKPPRPRPLPDKPIIFDGEEAPEVDAAPATATDPVASAGAGASAVTATGATPSTATTTATTERVRAEDPTEEDASYHDENDAVMDDSFSGDDDIDDYYYYPTYSYFQGAYIYRVDPVDGFTLQGTITHLPADSQEEDQYYNYWWYEGDFIQRILYIEDILYTTSRNQIRATRMDEYLTLLGRLSLR